MLEVIPSLLFSVVCYYYCINLLLYTLLCIKHEAIGSLFLYLVKCRDFADYSEIKYHKN